MQNSECQIGLVKDVEVRLWRVVTYDMFLTDKRMILIHTKRLKGINSALYWGFLVGAFILISDVEYAGVNGLLIGIPAILIGILIGYSIDRFVTSRRKGKENEIENLGFDKMLEKDKESFDVVYEDIEKIGLHIVMRVRRLDVTSKKLQKTFGLAKEQYEQLSTILPNIPALKGKLES